MTARIALIGDYKGYGLSLIIGLLAGTLNGAAVAYFRGTPAVVETVSGLASV